MPRLGYAVGGNLVCIYSCGLVRSYSRYYYGYYGICVVDAGARDYYNSVYFILAGTGYI